MILSLLLWIDEYITRCRVSFICNAIDREAVRGMVPVARCPCGYDWDGCRCVTDPAGEIAH